MQFLNKFSDIPVRPLHLENVELNDVTFVQLTNKFSGMLPVRLLQEANVYPNDVTFVQLTNKFSGMLPVSPLQ